MPDSARAKEIRRRLARSYPQAHIALTNWNTPWELLVAVELSAQCTDVRVNMVTKTVFAKYPTLDAYVNADAPTFEQDIKPTGFFRNKAKNILAAARMIRDQFGGDVPRTMKELLLVPGVARKTANVVLGNAYGVVEGIAVDTHVLRLSQRLRLVDLEGIGGGKNTYMFTKNGATIVDFKKDADPVKIERDLMNNTPKQDWFPTTYRLVDHGRAVCKSQRPLCESCVLSALCPASRV